MDHDKFIIACYAVTGLAMAGLIISSYIGMRRSEALADDLRRRD